LDQLLQFDPARRISCDDALRHPWLESYHEEEEEVSHSEIFDFCFEEISSIDEIRVLISKEIMEFKASHPTPVGKSGQLPANASSDRNSTTCDIVADLEEEFKAKGHLM
jgi:hypothetical protein